MELLHVDVPLRHPTVPDCHLSDIFAVLPFHIHLHVIFLLYNFPAKQAVALE